MNDCEFYQELISRLVDGELNKSEYAALEEHMKNCDNCSAVYAVFASLSDIIGSEDEPLPEDLHENIMAGVRRHAMINKNRRRLSKPVRNVLATAACAALVLFAARGLSPAEKAQESVLSRSETVVMDARLEEAAPAAPAPVQEAQSAAPAVTASPVPTATAKPTSTPVPTKDAYLGSGEDKKPAAGSTNTKNNSSKDNNKSNFVVVTATPTDIPVGTAAPKPAVKPVATPKPTPVPTPVPTAVPTPAPTPVPTAAPTPAPTPVTTVAPVTESAAAASEEAAPAVISAEPEETVAIIEQPLQTEPAEKESEAAATASPEPTKEPSFAKRFMAFLAPRSEADNAAVTQAEPEAAPAEEAENDTAEADMALLPVPAEESEEEPEIIIALESLEKLETLENLLDGVEAPLPTATALPVTESPAPAVTELPVTESDAAKSGEELYAEADRRIVFCLKEPEEILKDYRLEVYVFGEQIYYVQVLGEEERIECLAPCTVEEFDKFLDTLSEQERAALLLLPSPDVSMIPAPESSPAHSPEQSAESK